VAEKDGHYYAYCMNTYNGVYIFNVDNPAAPIRLGRVAVKTMTGGIQHFDGRGYIFPYNQYQQLQSPIAAIACEDGVLYMASSMTAMHIYNGEELQPFLHQAEEKSQSVTMDADNKTFYQLKGESLGLTEFVSYDSTGQVYAVVGWKEKLYAAYGAKDWEIIECNNRPGFRADPDGYVPGMMKKLYRELTGTEKEPFYMAGGTYARYLKNAFAVGTWADDPDREIPMTRLPAGRGSAHQRDEAVDLAGFFQAVRLLTHAVIACDKEQM